MTWFVVTRERADNWDWSRPLREQDGWDEHAAFMDALVEDGFVVLGGPLDDRAALLIVEAEHEDEIRARLAEDPWTTMQMLSEPTIRRWEVLLRRAGAP